MPSTTQKRRNAPRPGTDPARWRNVTGGRNIRRRPQQSNVQKALGRLPFGKRSAPAKGSRRGTAGTAAMLTAAAGVAYKNREKLGAMLGKRKQSSV